MQQMKLGFSDGSGINEMGRLKPCLKVQKRVLSQFLNGVKKGRPLQR